MQCLVSTAALPMGAGMAFHEYEGIFEAYEKLQGTGVEVDGVELVFLPEWDCRWSPVTPTSANWNETSKISPSETAGLCLSRDIPVPVVHINRDVGTRLCSVSAEDVLRGQDVLSENLSAALTLGSDIGVLHLWDTYAERIDIKKLIERVIEVSRDYPIRLAVENIPISDRSQTVSEVWNQLEAIMPPTHGFTLDLNWCSLYDNFAELVTHIDRILDVHVQGTVSETSDGILKLVPRVGELDILDSLANLCQMGYDGFITLELNRPTGLCDFEAALNMIASRLMFSSRT